MILWERQSGLRQTAPSLTVTDSAAQGKDAAAPLDLTRLCGLGFALPRFGGDQKNDQTQYTEKRCAA
ncbi:MAG: hypothetical protein AVDCRST_MAG86-32 [uncultured Truepera sp.]|uniref:Uncharacterized protein n=1 Tax=uncultured Truepera sp. TaxID=543023 RepID=A0A6J4UL83_9DEIN|nr:MAG: hypothetical protein AVDCRST_MAG86-32 [uncultured Truepera sp.]